MTSVTCISFSNSWDCGKLIPVKHMWPRRRSGLAEQLQNTSSPPGGPDTGGTVKCLWRRTEISVKTLTEQQNAFSVVVACLYLLFATRCLLFAMRSTKLLEQNIIRSRQPPRLLTRGKQSQKLKHGARSTIFISALRSCFSHYCCWIQRSQMTSRMRHGLSLVTEWIRTFTHSECTPNIQLFCYWL